MKKLLRVLLALVITLFSVVIVFVLYLSITEYLPEDTEAAVFRTEGNVAADETISVMSFNIGYAGLDKSEDFFMDGGTGVRPSSGDIITANLNGILGIMRENPADAYLLQETDISSKRSYYINEVDFLRDSLQMGTAFAYNFKCDYVPYPLPTIGKAGSGLLTMTNLKATEAVRISLPLSFSWPVRIANLKRCLLAERIPYGDKELVLINMHLEAYDSGEGKAAQSKRLADFIIAEYEKGNYVIAGGDFNQTFPGIDVSVYENIDDWTPGNFDDELLPDDWTIAFDGFTPTCRSLKTSYNDLSSITYVIDGFILSPNITLKSISTLDCGFEYSDHNPVILNASLN